MTTTAIAGLSRPKMISHRGSNMPPQAIPIYSSTGSSAATAETMMTMMMKTPPTAFNPRSSLSSTRLLESLKYASSSASDDGVAEKDLSALIGPEDDHKNHLPMLSQANIHHHNMVTSSSSPRAQQGLLRIASLQRATAAASAAERNLILSTSRIGSGGGGVGGPLDRNAEFPDFWEDAKQHNMHWTMYSIGLAVVASLVWILMLPALMIWVPIFPGAVVLLLSAQYSTYRWRRRRHYKQQLKDRRPSPAALSSMRAASAALTHSRSSSAVATAPSSPQFHAFSPNHHHLYNSNHVRGASIGGLVGNTAVGSNGMGHAYKSSLSSMHTSVGSIATTTSDSFLEPHQPPSSTSSPPHHLRSQFQHQYYRYSSGMGSVTGSSAASSPPRFSEAYSDSTSTGMPSPPTSCSRQAPVSQHTPSPEYRRSWFSAFRAPTNNTTNSNNSNNTGDTKNSNSGRWGRTIQRRESASSSIASSETVSSSSTDSRADSPSAAATRAAPAMAGSPTSATGSFSSIPMTSPPLCPSNSSSDINMHKLSSGDVSVIMIPPPPAYVSRRCEDMTSDLAKAIIMGSTAASNEKEHLELNEKGGTLLGGSGLPEIAPLGDLMSEFAVDFGAIMY
ncbi:hypothetical protein EC991_000359 [Linnemannia zychae]|nr:hypothetical protein EC991_000359 [Linnemannia zychae]